MLISGQQGGSLAVFDLGTGSLLSELSVAGGSVTSMALVHPNLRKDEAEGVVAARLVAAAFYRSRARWPWFSLGPQAA